MKHKVAIAGNMVVDILYKIDKYPNPGELAVMEEEIEKALGGAGCNNTLDFAKLDSKLIVMPIGRVGNDENGNYIIETFKQYKNIDTKLVKQDGTTSFTAVMNDKTSKQRTFFQFKGANAYFSPSDIEFSELDEVKIFHIGYLLLLDEFDKSDDIYGTKMAKVLSQLQSKGIETSIDVVSCSKGKFKEIVTPSLKYTDYCVINEFEAEQITDIQLRKGNDLINDNIKLALIKLKNLGVGKWAVIHAPEIVYGIDCRTDEIVKMDCLKLPDHFIKGTTGAGDALCTGILYGAYKNKTLNEAIKYGIASAVASLSEINAYDGIKPIDDVVNLYETLKNND